MMPRNRVPAFEELPRTIGELRDRAIEREEVLRVATARILFADYDLLAADFPWLAQQAWVEREPALAGLDSERLEEEVRRRVDEWILDQAVISQTQAGQTIVNTPISTRGEPVEVFRPQAYGRAVIREVREPGGGPGRGLVDIKGSGVRPGRTTHHGDHGSGILPLGEACEEYAYQQLLDAVFAHAGTELYTLPNYALLDLGFDHTIEPEASSSFPVGMLLRRAHRRPRVGLPRRGSPWHRVSLQVELLLRHYGITSATEDTYRLDEEDGEVVLIYRGHRLPFRHQPVLRGLLRSIRPEGSARLGGINIQTTLSFVEKPLQAVLLDFGHFEVRSRFEHPLLTMVVDRPMMWGGVLRPEDEGFVQPYPELAVDPERWGWVRLTAEEIAELGYPESYNSFSRLELLGIRLALAVRRGEISGSELLRTLDDLVQDARDRWPPLPGT